MILFRPTGQKELDLVAARGWKKWPPRLPDQPIIFPVTSFEYAEKTARDWNSVLGAPDNVGFGTRIEIGAATAAKYPLQLAGGRDHEELWGPAEDQGQVQFRHHRPDQGDCQIHQLQRDHRR